MLSYKNPLNCPAIYRPMKHHTSLDKTWTPTKTDIWRCPIHGGTQKYLVIVMDGFSMKKIQLLGISNFWETFKLDPRVLQHTKSLPGDPHQEADARCTFSPAWARCWASQLNGPWANLEPQSEDVSTTVENFNNILRLSLWASLWRVARWFQSTHGFHSHRAGGLWLWTRCWSSMSKGQLLSFSLK